MDFTAPARVQHILHHAHRIELFVTLSLVTAEGSV